MDDPVAGAVAEAALDRALDFGRRWGRGHLLLAAHAAFPPLLTPDLLYAIWRAFAEPTTPWTAVSDVLLSGLCREVSVELYALDPPVREALLDYLAHDRSAGPDRLTALAGFLRAYAADQHHAADPDVRALAEAQDWTGLVYLDPHEAARTLATAFATRDPADTARLARLTELVKLLRVPLAAVAPALLPYARGLTAATLGDWSTAAAAFATLPHVDGQITVAGIGLAVPQLNVHYFIVSEPEQVHFIVSEPEQVEMPVNEFLDVIWLEQVAKDMRGVAAARAVCRVETPVAQGTGFLVAPDLVLTAYHVIREVVQDKSLAPQMQLRFSYARQANSSGVSGTVYKLAEDWLVDSSPNTPDDLDYALLRLAQPAGLDLVGEQQRGWLQPTLHQFEAGESLYILHYPFRELLKVVFAPNAVQGETADKKRVKYKVHTKHGAGGAPCFTSDWALVAMRHAIIDDETGDGIPMAAICAQPKVKAALEAAARFGKPETKDEEVAESTPVPPSWTLDQQNRLRQALTAAFPNYTQLAKVAEALGQNLKDSFNATTPPNLGDEPRRIGLGQNLKDSFNATNTQRTARTAANLVAWAADSGQPSELITAALAVAPGDADLRALATELGLPVPPKWNSVSLRMFSDVLLEAFRSYLSLNQMLWLEMGVRLNEIVETPSSSIHTVIFDLIAWAEVQDKLDDLLTAARSADPHNRTLRDFAAEMDGFGKPKTNGEAAVGKMTIRTTWTAVQQAELQSALSRTIADYRELMKIAELMGESFARITGTGELREAVTRFTYWAAQEDRLTELLVAAVSISPGNSALKLLATEIGIPSKPLVQPMSSIEARNLFQALINSFPDKESLAKLTNFGLGIDLDEISSKANWQDIALDVVDWAYSQGQIPQLIEAGLHLDPSNQWFQQIVEASQKQA